MKLDRITIYPIKSCGSISVASTFIDRYGLKDDHRWMLVNGECRFLSQRAARDKPGSPRMALIQPVIEGGVVMVTAPGMPELQFDAEQQTGEQLTVSLHDDHCQVEAVGEKADAWFSHFLGIACRLVRRPDSFGRIVPPPWGEPEDVVGFADGFPFLITSTSSLADLNTRLAKSVEMSRFRPNLEFSGVPLYAEDRWKVIRIGEMTFRCPKPCGRCVIIDTDQEQGVRESGPLAALATYRRARSPGVDGQKVLFGENLIHVTKSGVINVGDELSVLDYRSEFDLPQFITV